MALDNKIQILVSLLESHQCGIGHPFILYKEFLSQKIDGKRSIWVKGKRHGMIELSLFFVHMLWLAWTLHQIN